MMMTPHRCWRGRTDCEPLHAIEGHAEPITDAHVADPAFAPHSFLCCGLIREDGRHFLQDCYRLCSKGPMTDEMSDNDLQDMTHTMAVISQALAVSATRMINEGAVSVPTYQGDPGNDVHPDPTPIASARLEFEWEADAKVWMVSSPDFPNLVLHGATPEEALAKAQLVMPALQPRDPGHE